MYILLINLGQKEFQGFPFCFYGFDYHFLFLVRHFHL